jgi:DNA polymerase-3 subunit gamma/tau
VCESCQEIDNSNAINYIEIDGASNNGVDNIREIVENVQYLPTFGSKKVYVIDEVHMLSTGAFNALLKTLEEPPAHVTFIFATTDPHKLLGTVLSRCQRFDFKHVNVEKLVEHLKNVTKFESIEVESEQILRAIAKEAKGSVRDSLSLLDQALSLSLNGKITSEQLSMSLGLASSDKVKNTVANMLSSDAQAMNNQLQDIINENIDLKKFLNQILDEIDYVVENIDSPSTVENHLGVDISNISLSEILWVYETLIKDFEWSLSSFDPNRVASLALLKVAKRYEIFNKEKKKVETKPTKPTQPLDVKADPEPEKVEKPDKQVTQVESSPESESSLKNWNDFIKYLYKELPSIAMNLERTRPLFDVASPTQNISLAFLENEKIFYDIINETANKKKLKEHYANFFDFDLASIKLHIEFISEGVKEEKNLQSTVEVEEKSIQDESDKKEEDIKSNKYIKEAQELFSSNIDRIVLNEKNRS